ncbi:hypothetical protein [Chitinimonas sp.]|uniref:hypothetical protein n=1 Tax=Chitinimonas sp. TaxID=1934313 RepID=UPI0035AE8747
MAYLIEIDAYPLPSGPAKTLRFSSGAGMRTRATDTPPLVHFSPNLSQPWLIRRDLFDKATTYGAIKSAKGQITLVNADGSLDGLLDMALDGREARAYVGTEGAPWPAGWVCVGRGIIETVQVSSNNIVLSLRDRLDALDQPLLTTIYAGNNVLPGGVEGVATDMGGKQKPRIYGTVLNLSPYLVNTAIAVYQLSDRLCSVSAVYDRGVALTLGATYPDVATMLSASPAPSTYNVCATATGTYIRLGSAPAGTVTADASTAETRTASLIQQIALDAGFTLADLATADVAALNAANPAPVGAWVEGTRTALDVINELASSIGAYVSFDNSNKLRMARLEAPAGQPVLTVQPARVVSLSLISTADGDKGIPPWQVVLGWGKCYSVQSDLTGNVPAGRKAQVCNAYRTVTAQDAAVRAVRKLAPTMGTTDSPIQTALAQQADAQAEANRRLALYKVGRRMFTVKVRLEPAQLPLIDLGVCINLVYPRYGLQAGKLLRVVGIEANAEIGQITMRLWG